MSYQNSDVPVQITMTGDPEKSSCAYSCGVQCSECIVVDSDFLTKYSRCSLGNCCSTTGAVAWCISGGMLLFGVLFLACDGGRISPRTGSCNFLMYTVAPSIFTFLLAASTAGVGTGFLLVVCLFLLIKKFGPGVCRRCCRCHNFASGLELGVD